MGAVVKHEGLKTIFTGRRLPISSLENEVCQFRGIKYGIIPARFRHSLLNTNFQSRTDATNFGPKSPQHVVPVRLEDKLIGVASHQRTHGPDVFDELDCLNLNVTAPSVAKLGDEVPVLVYVHGGGGFSGSNSDWWCDGGGIVKRSIEIRKPVIVVTVNYRLDVFGYLASKEFRREPGANDHSNFALHDIQTALEFLHNFISPFGGSPSNITVYGESHGSLLINALIHSSLPPLFHRAILQSQLLTAPIISTPYSAETSEATFTSLKAALSVTTIDELRAVPWPELLTAYKSVDPRLSQLLVIDNTTLKENWSQTFTFKGPIMLSTTRDEVAVIEVILSSIPQTSIHPPTTILISAFESLLGPTIASDILFAYGIHGQTMEEKAIKSCLQIAEDLIWGLPTKTFFQNAKDHNVPIREISFEQKNPFGGQFDGAVHALDLAYLHGSPEIFSQTAKPEKEMGLQRSLQDEYIDFAYGTGDQVRDEVTTFGPDGNVGVVERKEFLSKWRRDDMWGVWDGVDEQMRIGVLGTVMGHLAAILGRG